MQFPGALGSDNDDNNEDKVQGNKTLSAPTCAVPSTLLAQLQLTVTLWAGAVAGVPLTQVGLESLNYLAKHPVEMRPPVDLKNVCCRRSLLPGISTHLSAPYLKDGSSNSPPPPGAFLNVPALVPLGPPGRPPFIIPVILTSRAQPQSMQCCPPYTPHYTWLGTRPPQMRLRFSGPPQARGP